MQLTNDYRHLKGSFPIHFRIILHLAQASLYQIFTI